MFEAKWIAVAVIALAGCLMGGILGTSEDLRHATGPRERRMIKQTAAGWAIGLLIVMGTFFFIPHPWNLVWLTGGQLGNAWSIRHFNRRQSALRRLDATCGKTLTPVTDEVATHA